MMKYLVALCAVVLLLLIIPKFIAVEKKTTESSDMILSKMTIEEKVGQVIIGSFDGPTLSKNMVKQIGQLHLGGVILFSATGNIVDVNQVAKLTEDLQKNALSTGAKLPMLVSIDQEGCQVIRLSKGVTVFPGNMALGATGSAALTRQAANITGQELRAMGINLNFAPVVDVNNNPHNPVIGIRSFGSSPQEVAILGAAAVEGFTEAGVISAVKHFPGHGDTITDSHIGLPVINNSREHLIKTELYPFKALIKANAPMVMTAHVVVPALDASGLPATLSPIIMKMLREELGYSGVIVTDSLVMGAITKRGELGEASVAAFSAGADILLLGPAAEIPDSASNSNSVNVNEVVYQAMLNAVKSGRVPMEKLNESVKRILDLKKNFGLLENPFPKQESLSLVGSENNVKLAEQIAEQSLTIVKNNKLLPITNKHHVPIIWPQEVAEALEPLLAKCPFLEPHYFPIEASVADIAKLRAMVDKEQVVIVGTYNLKINKAWAGLVNSLEQKKVIALAMRSPYDLMTIPKVGTYVAAYGDKAVSAKALGKLLNGAIKPQGHLPVDLPNLYLAGWGLKE